MSPSQAAITTAHDEPRRCRRIALPGGADGEGSTGFELVAR